MTHTLVKSFALSALSIALAACGGGSNSASTKTPAPTVAVNENNLQAVLATALQVSLDSGAGNYLDQQSRPAPMVGSLGDGLSRALYTTNAGGSRTVDSATGIDFSPDATRCPFGGTSKASFSASPNLSATTIFDAVQVNLGFDFFDCRTDTLLLKGAADLRLLFRGGQLPNNSTINLSASATLADFSVAQVAPGNEFQQQFKVSGNVKLAISNPNRDSLEAKLWSDGGDLVYKLRNDNNESLRLNNFNSQVTSSLLNAQYQWTTSGNFSFLGNRGTGTNALPTNTIKFTTTVPFSGVGFVVPNKGVLRIEDDTGLAELRVVDEINLQYIYDSNHDKILDGSDWSSHSTWQAFLGATPIKGY